MQSWHFNFNKELNDLRISFACENLKVLLKDFQFVMSLKKMMELGIHSIPMTL